MKTLPIVLLLTVLAFGKSHVMNTRNIVTTVGDDGSECVRNEFKAEMVNHREVHITCRDKNKKVYQEDKYWDHGRLGIDERTPKAAWPHMEALGETNK